MIKIEICFLQLPILIHTRFRVKQTVFTDDYFFVKC